MREIKFRAWDKKKKQMIYDYDQDIEKKGYPIKLGGSIHLMVYTIGLVYKTLMQFTGLLDKQGKEIYEGDILKADSSYHRWGGLKSKWFYGELEFDPERGYYCVFKNTNRTDIDKNHVEVVGNIYKNPELIKVVK